MSATTELVRRYIESARSAPGMRVGMPKVTMCASIAERLCIEAESAQQQGVNMASRITEQEQRLERAKAAAKEMWQDSEKGDFELSELARLDLQNIINALWDDPDGKLWDEAETERQRRAGWEGLFAQQGVTDEACDRLAKLFIASAWKYLSEQDKDHCRQVIRHALRSDEDDKL